MLTASSNVHIQKIQQIFSFPFFIFLVDFRKYFCLVQMWTSSLFLYNNVYSVWIEFSTDQTNTQSFQIVGLYLFNKFFLNGCV